MSLQQQQQPQNNSGKAHQIANISIPAAAAPGIAPNIQLQRAASNVSENSAAATISNDQFKRLKMLVTNWFLQACLKTGVSLDRVKDLTLLFNEIRDGSLVCKLMNALQPGAIANINESSGTLASIENLTSFAGASFTAYGVDRKYMFKPIDFHNGTAKGEESVVLFLAAFALKGVERGFIINNFPANEARDLLETLTRERELLLAAQQSPSRSPLNRPTSSISMDNNSEKSTNSRPVTQLMSQRPSNINATSLKIQQQDLGSSSPSHQDSAGSTPGAALSKKLAPAVPHSPPDPSLLISKLLSKLDVLNSNQTRLYDRFDALSKTNHKQLIDTLTSNYETIIRKVVVLDTAQKDVVSYFKETLLVNTNISMDPEADDEIRALRRLKSTKEEANLLKPIDSSLPSTPVAAPVAAPKMFNKLPPEVVAANLPKPEVMRLSVIYEMIETEVDFVRDLNVMITFHKVQVKQQKILPDDQIARLFSNIEELVTVSQMFSDKLAERKAASPFIEEVGDIIAETSESFKVYSIYCGNYPTAMQLVHSLQSNPEVKDILQKWMMSAPECRGLSLESFLIKPVQRICKYPLLIREILRYTDKGHKDYNNLLSAAEKIDAVVKIANEATRLLGERDRLLSIQNKIDSHMPLNLNEKKLFKDGNSVRIVSGKAKERYIVLAGDSVIVCKIVKGQKYQIDVIIPVTELQLKTEKPEGKNKLLIQGTIGPSEKREVFTLSCTSEDDRSKWFEAFSEATKAFPYEENFKNKSNSRQSTMADKKKANRTSKTLKNYKFQTLKRMGLAVSENEDTIVADMPENPDMVEMFGQYWKKALAATGHIYYFNTANMDTIWKLAPEAIPVDPITLRPLKAAASSVVQEPEDMLEDDEVDVEEEEEDVETVEGWAEWRRVNRGDVVYYFNVITNETSWNLPNT